MLYEFLSTYENNFDLIAVLLKYCKDNPEVKRIICDYFNLSFAEVDDLIKQLQHEESLLIGNQLVSSTILKDD